MIAVYIASPYRLGNKEANVDRSILAGDELLDRGYNVFLPLLYHYWHKNSPKHEDIWMQMDLEWVKKCDFVLRLDGESAGADREVALARESGIPVFNSIDAIDEFVRREKELLKELEAK